jgi:putative transposase
MIGLARSTYHYEHKPREYPISDADLIAAMVAIKSEFPYYGSPRVTEELARRGCPANHKRVERLMKTNDLNVKMRRRFTCTTDSDHPHPIYPNLYRNVIPAQVDVVWVADITYIALEGDGFAYVAIILDACSRKVVGYAISKRVDANLALAALEAAIAARKPGPGCIHHSDRGVQYASNAYRKRLADNGIVGSMSALANPYDNAQAESFMKTLKVEEVYLASYKTYKDVVERLPRFIEDVYNTKRLHSALGYVPPQEFEDQLAQEAAA